MTENKGRFTKGDPRTLEAARKGGQHGGKVSPTNFKNNPELASKAGKLGKRKPVKEKIIHGEKKANPTS